MSLEGYNWEPVKNVATIVQSLISFNTYSISTTLVYDVDNFKSNTRLAGKINNCLDSLFQWINYWAFNSKGT